jgi:flagellar motor switch protein FliG
MKDEDIQIWLRKVDNAGVENLVAALLGADPETLACVTRNMSRYARETLGRDIQKARAMGINDRVINQKALELEKLF